MTMAELIYFIGMGVAFLMCCVGLNNTLVNGKNNEDVDIVGLLSTSLIISILSWALPIWWLGYHYIYEKDKNHD